MSVTRHGPSCNAVKLRGDAVIAVDAVSAFLFASSEERHVHIAPVVWHESGVYFRVADQAVIIRS